MADDEQRRHNTNQQFRILTQEQAIDRSSQYQIYEGTQESFNEQRPRYTEQSYNEQRVQYTEQPYNSHDENTEQKQILSDTQQPHNEEQNTSYQQEYQENTYTEDSGEAAEDMKQDYENMYTSSSVMEDGSPATDINKFDKKADKIDRKIDKVRRKEARLYRRASELPEEGEASSLSYERYKRLYHRVIGRERLLYDKTHNTEEDAERLAYAIRGLGRREANYRKNEQDKYKKQQKQEIKNRLIFSKSKELFSNEDVEEDANAASLRRSGSGLLYTAKYATKSNINRIKKYNNVFARLKFAQEYENVLQDKKIRLSHKKEVQKNKEALREARTREERKRMKTEMVRQMREQEGNFFRRTVNQLSMTKRSVTFQHKKVRKILTLVLSASGILVIIILVIMFIFVLLTGTTDGLAQYYSSAIIQNDYTTLSDATAYFRALETDMEEFFQDDKEMRALEKRLQAQYGNDIYSFSYELPNFDFNGNTLTAYLAAKYGSFDAGSAEIKTELERLFNEMYTMEFEITYEDRDINGVLQSVKICHIRLNKTALEDVVEASMTDEEKKQYDIYKLSSGGQQVYSPVMREDWAGKITSNYGERIHPITGDRTFHNGVDIGIPEGTKLYSAIDGTVKIARYSDSAGNYVRIQGDTGWKVIFMHMQSIAVSEGEKVEKGDFVGYSGNSGKSTGPHLHLEVRDAKDNTINPIFIIPQTCYMK